MNDDFDSNPNPNPNPETVDKSICANSAGGASSHLRPHRRRRLATELPNPLIIPDDAPCPPANQTMVQGFEWYMPADFQHWRRLADDAIVPLSQLGVTSLWLPPASKAAWPQGNGYDTYDLFDLGEFDQKGARHTKWGSKEELQRLVDVASGHGIKVLFDAVLNHKAAADYSERVVATKVDPKDRTRPVKGQDEEYEIEAWTGYRFPGRGDAHSPLKWNKKHFTGIDYDSKAGEKGVWKFKGKEWAEDVDEELGNYDYLMFADVDHKHPEVRRDLFHWVSWLSAQMKHQIGGLRLDAIKHFSFAFLRDLLAHIDNSVNPYWFIVGEYWREDSEFLAHFIEYMNHRLSLFDVQLVSNFSRVSLLEEKGDLRTIFDDALVVWKPENAVQLGQSLETPVAPFFIPLAYSLILLRANAGLPCVFWSDLYGSFGPHNKFAPPTSGGQVLPRMMLARQRWAYGTQVDYFDDPNCIGFTRFGHPLRSRGDGLAVVMTNSWTYASKRMCVGARHAGEVWTDVLRLCPGEVVIDSSGFGVFPVGFRSVAVWVDRKAHGRGAADGLVL
ncbi:alpha-amylase-like protein [Podospora didyma]|uniref:Alpha-amylase-like protein n=1 Tax=Podospora didyma TaxID=330526 RepID=A0AAE0TZV0_9PEZI|nr:alpha-amylase-like protein [Podospora didyma]